MVILAYLMLVLLIFVGVEIFQGSGVQCTVPASVETSSCHQNLCYGIFIFILAHALAIIVPDHVWASFQFKYSRNFFTTYMENKLNVSRNKASNTCALKIIKIIPPRLVYSYYLKLGIQFVVTLFSFIFGVYFYSFSPSFTCSRGSSLTADDWPLNSTVTCVFSLYNIIPIIQYVDCVLVGLAAISTLIGLVQCFLRHPLELSLVCGLLLPLRIIRLY